MLIRTDMPASTADPVGERLQAALCTKVKGLPDTNQFTGNRVLMTTMEMKPVANDKHPVVLNVLKSLYTVVSSEGQENGICKNGSGNDKVVQAKTQQLIPTPKVVLFPRDDVRLGWQGVVPVGSGFVNVANTCYLNATLQALFHVPSFVNWLLNARDHTQQCEKRDFSDTCTVCAMARTLRLSQQRTGNAIKPQLIYSKLKQICKRMTLGHQEDAHEFLRYLIESMEKSYLIAMQATKLDKYSKCTTPLNQIFEGYMRSDVECLRCKSVSTTVQPFQDLALDIRHGSTLLEALNGFFSYEKLEGDNAYHCEKCGMKVSATKKFSLERAPNVLCIQLKRFNAMNYKIHKHLPSPRTIDLKPYVKSPSLPSSACPSILYRLSSLVQHVGGSLSSGHYTAVAASSAATYYHFDDCSVRQISAATAMSTDAYMLMYELIKPVSPVISQMGSMKAIQPFATPITVKKMPLHNGLKNGYVSPLRDLGTVVKGNDTPMPLPPVKERNKVVFGINNPVTTTPKSTSSISTSTCTTSTSQALTAPVVSHSFNGGLVPYLNGDSSDSDEDNDNDAKIKVKKNAEKEKCEDEAKTSSENNGNTSEDKHRVVPNGTGVSQNGSAESTTKVRATSGKWQVNDDFPIPNQCSDMKQDVVTQETSIGVQNSVWTVTVDVPKPVNGHGPKENIPVQQSVMTNGLHKNKEVGRKRHLACEESAPDSPEFVWVEKPPVNQERLNNIKNGDIRGGETSLKRMKLEAATPKLKENGNHIPKDGVKSNGTSAAVNGSGKWDGNRNSETSNKLKQMNARGYGGSVQSWNGGRSHIDRSMADERRTDRYWTHNDAYNEEIDRGREHKNRNQKNQDFHEGKNPFQVLQDSRNSGSAHNYSKNWHRRPGYSQNRRDNFYHSRHNFKSYRSSHHDSDHHQKSQHHKHFRHR